MKLLVIGVLFLSAVLTVLSRPDQHGDAALALVAVGGIVMVLVAVTIGGVW